jgi:dienelactone hydrolase
MDSFTAHLFTAQIVHRLAIIAPLLTAALAVAGSPRPARADTKTAEIKTETIEYKDGDTVCKGFLARPDVDKQLPCVIVFPEWWGQTDYPRNRAKQLAELGYVAFAADLYGNGQTADDAPGATALSSALYKDRAKFRARAAAALTAVTSMKEVNSDKVVAIGYCFGGTAALELARSGADIAGVVAFHSNLATPNPADAKNIKAKILVINGGDDAFCTADAKQAFEKEMRDAKVDWTLVDLGNAVHAFTNPDADRHNIPNIKYNAKADKQSWEMLKQFLTDLFAQ